MNSLFLLLTTFTLQMGVVSSSTNAASAAGSPQLGVEELLQDGDYDFCTSEKYFEDRPKLLPFCLLLKDKRHSCPAAQKKCQELFDEAVHHGPYMLDEDESSKLKDITKGKFKFVSPLIWIVIGFGIAALIYYLAAKNSFGRWNHQLPGFGGKLATSAELQAEENLSAEQLWKKAEQQLQLGELEESSRLLHFSLLKHLDRIGLIHFQHSRTNGDYLRRLRGTSVRNLFAKTARLSEQASFGKSPVSTETITRVLRELSSVIFEKGKDGFLALLFVFMAFGLSGCTSQNYPGFESHEADGLSLFPKLLEKAGLEVEVGNIYRKSSHYDWVILRTSSLTKNTPSKTKEWLEYLHKHHHVLVIDDAWNLSDFLPLESQRRPPPKVTDEPKFSYAGNDFDSITGWPLPIAHSWSYSKEESLEFFEQQWTFQPLLSETAEGHTIALKATALLSEEQLEKIDEEQLPIYDLLLVSDRDLFTNASLARPKNMEAVFSYLLLEMINGSHKVLILDAPMTPAPVQEDEVQSTGLKLSRMVPFIIQALLFLVFLNISIGARFKPVRQSYQARKRSLAEHARALGYLYHQTGDKGLLFCIHVLSKLLVSYQRQKVSGGGAGWFAIAKDLARQFDVPLEVVIAALRPGLDGKGDLPAPGNEEPTVTNRKVLSALSTMVSAHVRNS